MRPRRVRTVVASTLSVLLCAVGGGAVAATSTDATAAGPTDGHVWGSTTSRVSVGTGGQQAAGPTYCCPDIAAHGRYVAFESEAANLVPGDTNGVVDVFVRDRRAGTTRRVSVATGGTQANGQSIGPSLSQRGRFVAFTSEATNLAGADRNDAPDVFVHDLRTARTVRVSTSANGRPGDGPSADPQISAGGYQVAFTSEATDLVPGDTNATADVFVRDWATRTTRRVSVSGDGGQAGDRSFGSVISPSGRYVAFVSLATDLVARDTNGVADIFLRDRLRGSTTRVNLGPRGQQARTDSPFDTGFPETISARGRFVSFDSNATNLVPGDTNESFDVFVRDRRAAKTTRVSVDARGRQLGGHSFTGPMSAGGRHVVFWSLADGVVPGDDNGVDDLFVRDRRERTSRLVTVALGGYAANDTHGGAAITGDGQHIAFFSFASDLVRGDTNEEADVFVRDRRSGF